MQRNTFIKMTHESKFSRKFASWANNHVKPWATFKTTNRRLARRRLKESLQKEIKQSEEDF